MKKINYRFWIVWIVFCVLIIWQSRAQETPVNADSLFISARTLAINKDYSEAHKKCNELLLVYPNYHDARVLIGRMFAWQQQYDSARYELNKVLIKTNYEDAIEAMIDVENWSGNQKMALYYCDLGQKNFPANENFGLKKARILIQSKETGLAQREILHALELDPGNLEARNLVREIKDINILNKISVQYLFEYYKEPWERKWHLTNLDYSRQTRWGVITARMYLGDVVYDGESLFEKNTSVQYELESYPVISKKNYAYLNYGYSSGDLFPEHRLGIELYQKLLKTFELSAGFRYLRFRNAGNQKNNVFIYTGSLGKYLQNYWFSFRPYLNSGTNGLSQSYYLTIRRYLTTKDNFISLDLGSGNSPDDPLDYAATFDTFKLNMKKLQFSWHQLFFDRWVIYMIVAYQNEEYLAGSFRNDYSCKIQLGYHF